VVLAVSTQRWEELPGGGEPQSAGLVYLSDPESRVIGAWDLRHVSLGADVARPAAFLVDRQGRIAWRALPGNWRERTDPADWLGIVALAGATAPAPAESP
jgi:peroxiredoxin